MSNPIVTSLPKYVEEHRLPLIGQSVLGAKTPSMLTLQGGIKGETAVNLLATSIAFQDAHACGFDPNGEAELSQRVIKPAYVKVNMEFCDKNLLDKWTSYAVKIAATGKELPFEEDFMGQIADKINYGIEKMVWQGDSDNVGECDGLIKILDADGAIAVTATTGTSAYQMIKDVYMATPENVIQNENLVIFVSPSLFREYVQEIVALNLYHYDANDAPLESVLPGTNVKIVAVNGLANTVGYDYVVAASLDNLFYGTDGTGDKDAFDFWYSQDNRVFRLAVEFLVGVQVAFPSEVVLGKRAK